MTTRPQNPKNMTQNSRATINIAATTTEAGTVRRSAAAAGGAGTTVGRTAGTTFIESCRSSSRVIARTRSGRSRSERPSSMEPRLLVEQTSTPRARAGQPLVADEAQHRLDLALVRRAEQVRDGGGRLDGTAQLTVTHAAVEAELVLGDVAPGRTSRASR